MLLTRNLSPSKIAVSHTYLGMQRHSQGLPSGLGLLFVGC